MNYLDRSHHNWGCLKKSAQYSIPGQLGSSSEQFSGGITIKVRRETCPA